MDFNNLTKQQRKFFIEECVREFIKQFPLEYAAICESAKKQRGLKKDEFGLMEQHQFGKEGHEGLYMRWSLRLPQRLFSILDKKLNNPRFLENDEEMNWFKNTFSEFRVCERT